MAWGGQIVAWLLKTEVDLPPVNEDPKLAIFEPLRCGTVRKPLAVVASSCTPDVSHCVDVIVGFVVLVD
jgi:hypothetical protein